jgi:hypothetical protein
MEPVQRTNDLVLPDITAFVRPVLRLFDEITHRQPDVTFDGGRRPRLRKERKSDASAARHFS